MQGLASGALALLATPLPAAILGLAFGVGLFLVCRFGAGFFTADEPEIGMVRALVVNALAMGAALGVLTLYFVFVRAGFVGFGLGLVSGFTSMALVELFRSAGRPKARYARR